MKKEQMKEYVSKMLTTDASMFYENFCKANSEHQVMEEVQMRGIARVYDCYGREVAAGLVLWLFTTGRLTKADTILIWNWLAA